MKGIQMVKWVMVGAVTLSLASGLAFAAGTTTTTTTTTTPGRVKCKFATPTGTPVERAQGWKWEPSADICKSLGGEVVTDTPSTPTATNSTDNTNNQK